MYVCISLPSAHRHPAPLGHRRAQIWALCATQQLAVLHMVVYIYVSATLLVCLTLCSCCFTHKRDIWSFKARPTLDTVFGLEQISNGKLKIETITETKPTK